MKKAKTHRMKVHTHPYISEDEKWHVGSQEMADKIQVIMDKGLLNELFMNKRDVDEMQEKLTQMKGAGEKWLN